MRRLPIRFEHHRLARLAARVLGHDHLESEHLGLEITELPGG